MYEVHFNQTFWEGKMEQEKSKVWYRPYVIIMIVVLLAELLVFNWRYFEGMGYTPTELTGYTGGSGVSCENGYVHISDKGDKYIEFNDVNAKINNVYLDIADKRNDDPAVTAQKGSRDYQRVNLVLSVTDEANMQYMNMPDRYVAEGVERTKYIRLHTAGESTKLKIAFKGSDNQDIEIRQVVINKQVPFSLNIVRIIFIYAVILLLYTIRKSSGVYDTKFNRASKKQLWVMIAVIAANIALSGVMCFTNEKFMYINMAHHKQYDHLAQSFMEHKLYLANDEPSEELKNMKNPYDRSARVEGNVPYRWDNAYYNGKYYVYFGALPVLVYYLPARAITGQEFNTTVGIFINLMVFIIFAFVLMRKIADKWFKDLPFVNMLLLTEVFVASSGVIFAMRKADFYSMPITMSLALVVMGLYFWLEAFDRKMVLSQVIFLAAGSLFMALVAGCRPQFLVASFLAIPLFWNTVFKDRKLFSKKSLAQTAAFVLPYVVVAAVVMWYNYERFGSVFDFGANYNLTTNDMTRRGFVLGRLPLGLFAYFIQLPVTYARFPFFTGTNMSNYYMGTTINEMMLGGIIATQPVLWLLVFTRKLKDRLKQKGLFAFVICAVVFSVVVAAADTEMAGILYRYYMDYSYLMLLAAVLVAFTLCEGTDRKGLLFGVAVLSVACLYYDWSMLFVQGDYSHDSSNPNFYYAITSALTFWL
jgi:hypothetical protein